MEFEGTKGKWEKILDLSNGTDNATIIIYSEDEDLNTISICETRSNSKEDNANAKLIAAAPKLLEALQELMRTYNEKGQLLSFNVDIARQAVKKALE